MAFTLVSWGNSASSSVEDSIFQSSISLSTDKNDMFICFFSLSEIPQAQTKKVTSTHEEKIARF